MNAQELISEIKNNRTSGASELTVTAVGYLLGMSEQIDTDKQEVYFQKLVEFGREIVSAQPSMAPLFNSVNNVLLAVESKYKEDVTVDELKTIVRSTSRNFIVNSKKVLALIKEQTMDLIEDNSTILTHSYSATVIESLVFTHSERRNIKVIVCESRPLFEGRNTANILSDAGIRTILVADFASFHFLDKVDLIMTGCDCICDLGVINKIGTKGLAMAAFYHDSPLFVAGDKNKFLPKAYMDIPLIEEKMPSEILENQGDIEIKNIYFDVTPYKFIKGIITEDGIIDSIEVKKILKRQNICSRLLEH